MKEPNSTDQKPERTTQLIHFSYDDWQLKVWAGVRGGKRHSPSCDTRIRRPDSSSVTCEGSKDRAQKYQITLSVIC